MKKIILFIGLTLILFLTSCENSRKQSKTTNSNGSDNGNDIKQVSEIRVSKQVSERKISNLLTQQRFEKMLKTYGISLYPNLKFKDIKKNDYGNINIIYTVPDVSDESHEKVCSYIKNEFLKLENNGWSTIPVAHIAMKKEGDKKIAIQINEAFYKPSNLHEIYVAYGTVE